MRRLLASPVVQYLRFVLEALVITLTVSFVLFVAFLVAAPT